MTQTLSASSIIHPPSVYDSNEPDAFVKALRSPWYALVADLFHVVRTATAEYAHGHGLRNLPFPLTTRTVTCPTALGSDSEPVPVSVLGVDTYLPDSMQFALEYGCRLAPGGCYDIQPSYRGEIPDETHLNQYTHSEAEIPCGLEELIAYVDGYVKALATAVLDQHGDRLAAARGDISHLERMAGHASAFEQVTFAEAVRIVGDTEGCVRDEGSWRSLTRKGERLLMERVSEFVWVHHFDSLGVPFYQAFGDENGRTARNADLYFGLGEIIGGGERHADAEILRKSIAMHGVNEQEYAWYVRMREELPMRTAGFGMGVERFLMWVLSHGDIRDIPLISRLNETPEYPAAVIRP
ncbi:asparaginase [Streptomyces sp. ISL-1]|uniref:amino acid--tRNA ligase-related protein n=1 Tax=Streptomyces sp. ISL-1 TaxID=2817657 RepID=UPI001BE80352|nr:amino acid--tRNA ligase-related protein [Streptomyces sp. ISL-1]MBT2393900.1 asparaginase [Streptomyces sp. ISL-1]